MAFKITYQIPPFGWVEKTTIEETTREEAVRVFKLQYPQAKVVNVERCTTNEVY